MYLIVLLYALFASVFTAAKIGLDHSEPFFLVGSRMVTAGILLTAYCFAKKQLSMRIILKHFPLFFLLALFNIYLTNGLEFWGMQYLSSSKTCFIYSMSPFIAATLSYFAFGEKLSKNKIVGLGVGVLGFIPILISTQGEMNLSEFAFISLAEIAVIGAATSTVLGWIFMRKLLNHDISPLAANGISMLIGGGCALIHSMVTETWNPIPVHGNMSMFLQSSMWMILVSSLICYNLYGILLKRFSVTMMSFAGFITPFFTAFYGFFIIGEKASLGFWFSSLIVFLGLYLFYKDELKEEKSKDKK